MFDIFFSIQRTKRFTKRFSLCACFHQKELNSNCTGSIWSIFWNMRKECFLKDWSFVFSIPPQSEFLTTGWGLLPIKKNFPLPVCLANSQKSTSKWIGKKGEGSLHLKSSFSDILKIQFEDISTHNRMKWICYLFFCHTIQHASFSTVRVENPWKSVETVKV